MEFCAALEGGSTEDAEQVYRELLADLYAVQFHMQVGGRARLPPRSPAPPF